MFTVTIENVQQLLERKLFDSAEYWSSFLIKENGLDPVELWNRNVVYADCLFANEKYAHAQVFSFFMI